MQYIDHVTKYNLPVPRNTVEHIFWNSLIQNETGAGGPLLVGDNGNSLGLFQVSLGTIGDYEKRFNETIDWKDPLQLFKVADWYFFKEIPRIFATNGTLDDTDNRVMAYNAGPSYFAKHKFWPASTKEYLKNFWNNYKIYKDSVPVASVTGTKRTNNIDIVKYFGLAIIAVMGLGAVLGSKNKKKK